MRCDGVPFVMLCVWFYKHPKDHQPLALAPYLMIAHLLPQSCVGDRGRGSKPRRNRIILPAKFSRFFVVDARPTKASMAALGLLGPSASFHRKQEAEVKAPEPTQGPEGRILEGLCYCGSVSVCTIAHLPTPVTSNHARLFVHSCVICIRECAPRCVSQIRAVGEPMFYVLCHCEPCRTWTGGVAHAVCMYKSDQVTITGDIIQGDLPFRKPMANPPPPGSAPPGFSNRKVCKRCFAAIINDHTEMAQMVDLPAGLFNFGNGGYKPFAHVNYVNRIFDFTDKLPKYVDGPAFMGGTDLQVDNKGNTLEPKKSLRQKVKDALGIRYTAKQTVSL
jgi:hypothetical protein